MRAAVPRATRWSVFAAVAAGVQAQGLLGNSSGGNTSVGQVGGAAQNVSNNSLSDSSGGNTSVAQVGGAAQNVSSNSFSNSSSDNTSVAQVGGAALNDSNNSLSNSSSNNSSNSSSSGNASLSNAALLTTSEPSSTRTSTTAPAWLATTADPSLSGTAVSALPTTSLRTTSTLLSSQESLSESEGTAGDAEAIQACRLLASSFAWYLQGFLGVVCSLSLVAKRFTDRVRRPWKIWFFDCSKQGFSAMLVHMLNIGLSAAYDKWLDIDADPCNWYWINLTLDDTVGLVVQYALLRLLQFIYRSRCVDRPELALSGEYGDPPSCRIWARQMLDWQCLVLLQKWLLAVFVIKWAAGAAAIGSFLLGWLDRWPKAKLVIVMVFTPLIMNMFALWVADTFLQADPDVNRHEHVGLPCTSRSASTIGSTAISKDTDSLSGGDDDGRVVGFQEWKKRSYGHGRNAFAPFQ